jgi:hypothetical protein
MLLLVVFTKQIGGRRIFHRVVVSMMVQVMILIKNLRKPQIY